MTTAGSCWSSRRRSRLPTPALHVRSPSQPLRPAHRRGAARRLAGGDRHQADAARARPPGRRPARLRGAPDQAAADGHAGGARPRARHHARPRRLARRRRARAAALRRGPDRRQPPGRQERRARRRPGRHDGADVLLRLGTEHPRRGLQDQPGAGQRRPAADQRPLQRGQARVEVPAGGRREQHDRRASSTRSTRSRTSRSTTASRTRAARRSRRTSPTQEPDRARPRSSRSPRASSSCATWTSASRGPAARRGRPVVGDQGQPGPRRHRHQEPGAELRGRHRRPADRHDGVQRQGPQGVRRDDARDRPARRRQRGAQRRPAEPDRRLAPLRDPARQRADLDAVHQLPREPRRHRRLARAPRSPAASRSRPRRTSRGC